MLFEVVTSESCKTSDLYLMWLKTVGKGRGGDGALSFFFLAGQEFQYIHQLHMYSIRALS